MAREPGPFACRGKKSMRAKEINIFEKKAARSHQGG
jgi:hypothetical protein